ncbi:MULTISPECIES: GNAT family N-acetyltransferase [Allobacillus]|uniref:N-acetyltransferase n=1 Tax=Allobacillus salarius TaxID=1955272 RepID=A0A556P6P2_9BACI|nr:GNAT family N-acetyltransferase [Allobacillus salarius]TSJ60061.1 N-acetyltransferase [Allobacillus salarius]
MEIKKGVNQLFIGEESNPDAQIVFEEIDANTLEVTHTEVSESMQGTGTGGKLVDAMVDYAREQDKKLVASCPYADKKLAKNEAYQDVYKG